MSTADPTNQQADQPPSQPTAQPTPPPTSPNADQQYASSARVPRRLVRRTDDRMIGGVCAGLADHLGLDPTLVRVLTVVVTVLGFGSVVIAYLVAWVIIPTDVAARSTASITAPYQPPPASAPVPPQQG